MLTTSHKIDWLFEPNLSVTELSGSIRKFQFPYPAELATGHSEHLEVYEGITLVRDIHQFSSEDRPTKISLGNFKVDISSVAFTSHIMHSGRVDFFDNNKNRHFERKPGVDILGRVEFIDIEQTLITEEDIFLSAIFIPEIQMFKLLGSEIAENFFNNLGLFESSDYCEVSVPQSISNKIANCTPDHLEGNMRSLFAQSIILQYLLELNLYISSEKSFLTNLEKDDFNVAALHSELLQVTADIPNLAELSKKYNVSSGKLNQAFIKKYDQSIYSFLSNQRLDQAYQALINTDVPMKTLAHKIGYSHVNHFITAFKKKFGVTPGSIRNQL